MTHITQEQALLLEDWATEKAAEQTGMAGEWHPDQWKVEAHLLCNAAIEWHIAQQETPTHVWAATSKTMQVLFANESDARKLQPTVTSAFDVRQVPVYGAAQAAPKVDAIDTSQERVQKTAKSEQVPLTDEQIKACAEAADEDWYSKQTDALWIVKFVRAIEAAHGIGGKV